VDAHAAFIGRALDALAIDRAHLVVHDFGGPWALRWAAEHPDRFASAVLLNTGVLPGYRWHALARVWRTPLLGELFMAATTRAGFRLLLRRGNPRGLPRAFVDRMYHDFDRHTRRAVLELYRSVPDVAAAGERLAAALRPLDRPALVLWGRHDPYLPATLADRQRDAFPHAEIRVVERSGHWPFIDDHETTAAAITAFLARHAGTRTGPDPRPLSTRDVARIVARHAAAAGVPEDRRTPHVLRHTFCTHLADADADVAVIRELAGHADIRTTTIYTAVSDARLEHAMATRCSAPAPL
jgi:integrase